MTTIAFRAGVLAADSQLTGRSDVRLRVKKIKRLKDGSLFAGSGTASLVNKMERWQNGGQAPKIEEGDEAECIIIRPDGTVFLVDEELELEQLENEYTAIGNGAGYAIGAMAFGATAEEAIKIAAEHDSNTSLPVHSMRLKE